jgi:glycosyltransferase involved in cell wall biosynthesis
MNEELISVVITTYARPNTLERAINSVCKQTYTNLEIIIVDDNTDTSIREQVKQIANSFHDSRIKVICNERNLGGALSRNVGINASNGKLVSFLDDDDEYLPNRISEQYLVFKTSTDDKLALVYTYCREVGKSKKGKEYKYDYVGNCILASMIDCIAATSQWMCRKEYLYNVGLFSDVPCKQDSTVIVKLMVAGYSLDRVPKILSLYHTDELIRISSNNHKKRIEGEERLRQLCRDNYDLIKKDEIALVECSFACRLAEHYLALKQYRKFADSMKNILRKPLKKDSLRVYKHLIVVAKENLFGAKELRGKK